MNFVCQDCAKGVHTLCTEGWCDCQHVIRPKPDTTGE